MSTNTTIEWTEATWNPIRGCSMAPGSEAGGCLNCYAARQAIRHASPGGSYEGLARMTDSGPRWTGKILPVIDNWEEPFHWKSPRRVFVNSMSDLFHEHVALAWMDSIFATMQACPQHTFQVLTKRPDKMLYYLSGHGAEDRVDAVGERLAAKHGWCHANEDAAWPLKNVWLGVSVENQATADARIPLLLQTPAAVRWVSYEPALGPVDFKPFLWTQNIAKCQQVTNRELGQSSLDWIVCGGESGPGARPMHPDWARSVRDQCKAAGVAFFFKQWGNYGPEGIGLTQGIIIAPDGKTRPYREKFDAGTGDRIMYRVGKKKAGRLLEHQLYSEYPQ